MLGKRQISSTPTEVQSMAKRWDFCLSLGVIIANFVSKEWMSVLRSLSMYLSHARWINPLTPQVDLLNCKPSQLRLAQQVGLTVPKTTITNNPPAVEKLFSKVENGRVVFKSLTGLFVPPDIGLFTTEITKEFPSVSQDGIAHCPSIYQELVERRSDLRITVVGCLGAGAVWEEARKIGGL